jgi:hypothetical protein
VGLEEVVDETCQIGNSLSFRRTVPLQFCKLAGGERSETGMRRAQL